MRVGSMRGKRSLNVDRIFMAARAETESRRRQAKWLGRGSCPFVLHQGLDCESVLVRGYFSERADFGELVKE